MIYNVNISNKFDFGLFIDIINCVTICWMTCSFMQLAMLQFETKLLKFIRIGITVFKIFRYTVKSEIFARILFSQIAKKVIFVMLKNRS